MRTPSSALWVLIAFVVGGSSAAGPIPDEILKQYSASQNHTPIAEIDTYYPELHDCPTFCSDLANPHSWIPYLSVQRLERCAEPMLLDFSVTQALDTTVLIRACSLVPTDGLSEGDIVPTNTSSPNLIVENPKKSEKFAEPSLHNSLACTSSAGLNATSAVKIEIIASHGSAQATSNVIRLLQGVKDYFENRENCDESFLFASQGSTSVGVFIGASLGKASIKSTVDALILRTSSGSSISGNFTAQLCGSDRSMAETLGVAVNVGGDLAAVQRTAYGWSQGICVNGTSETQIEAPLTNVLIQDLASTSNATMSSLSNGLGNLTNSSNSVLRRVNMPKWSQHSDIRSPIAKRDTCRYIKVESGDSCSALASRCGISGADFTKYNTKPDYCSTLQPGDYACCSAGDPYTAPRPQPDSNGVCATHLIAQGDTCSSIAAKYGSSVNEIILWNNYRVWGWTSCEGIQVGYSLCVSSGEAPLPPPQAGTQCGPQKPGTTRPAGKFNVTDLNPCPLNTCCSNYGFCGVFGEHCDLHPAGGVAGPGTKAKEFVSTCISNCGNEIKINSGLPEKFQRVGYYESYNMGRKCLWLRAANSNTDGSYTHMHWAFAEIDPNTWKVVINDPHGQWADFKALKTKRIVSFGGWAYSTEAATYNILRRAIIDNADTFAANVAQFVADEGLDGVDFDWEYPGAPDIFVNGQRIAQDTDGFWYYVFIYKLKQKIAAGKSVSIAAPASYWYLKGFPIKLLSDLLDYIVYMTYDLHGQWDYGNPNSFDSCPSGKCIRSHVNLTETRNTLSLITKAGVPNNKIFVGESSYGRSFKMAQNFCWGPDCLFTGSREFSEANKGRCTDTAGYISNAEIDEIIRKSNGDVYSFHDGNSNTDVVLYKGDYIGYMTPTTKSTRRKDWADLHFAGTIDWAVDLQAFTSDEFTIPPTKEVAFDGQSCIWGTDASGQSGTLCDFTCTYGYCPQPLCQCVAYGTPPPLPAGRLAFGAAYAVDRSNYALSRLCNFACQWEAACDYNFCEREIEEDRESAARAQNQLGCIFYEDRQYRDLSVDDCLDECKPEIDAAKAAGRTYNYGCSAFTPGLGPLPWEGDKSLGRGRMLRGTCLCDSPIVNMFAETFIEAAVIAAQIGCYVLMSALKLVIDIGLELFPPGRVLSAGLDAVVTMAQLVNYVYPEGEAPEDAFSYWLLPCGNTDMVPEDITRAFDILSQVSHPGSFKTPPRIPRGSGRKGDDGNPTDRSAPRNNNNNQPAQRCNVPPSKSTFSYADGQTLRLQSCIGGTTHQTLYVPTAAAYAPNAASLVVGKECSAKWNQACYHYSSAISNKPAWATLTCPDVAAFGNHRLNGRATKVWDEQHAGKGWKDHLTSQCDMDEWPPAALLDAGDDAMIYGGVDNRGQMVRFLPYGENRGAGQMWNGLCFGSAMAQFANAQITNIANAAPGRMTRSETADVIDKKGVTTTRVITTVQYSIALQHRPELTITKFPAAQPSDGLRLNPCWNQVKAPQDPGMALLTYDNFYGGMAPPYDYRQPA